MTAQARPDELIRILRAEFVTKAGGVPGAACVIFACGATGWRATGGTIARTLVHEVAFQLTGSGNARGTYAIDLQQEQFDATYVAAAPNSAILSNLRNKIESDCDHSIIIGSYNVITGASEYNYILGDSNSIDDVGVGNNICGLTNWIRATQGNDSWGNFVSGYSQYIDGAWACAQFIEDNRLIATATQEPWYSIQGGISNDLVGDTFLCFQFGEQNKMFGTGGAGSQTTLWNFQFGFHHYLKDVQMNYAFGQDTNSEQAGSHDEFLNGRIVWSGDYANTRASAATDGSGQNQDSWFSQNDWITNWPVAWTTSRFEFPLYDDTIWGFTIHILGTEQGCANSYHWEIQGAIENDGGNTTILWSTVFNRYRDVATKEWQAVADNVNNRLVFQYRDTGGPDATICNIQMSLFTIEVGYDA